MDHGRVTILDGEARKGMDRGGGIILDGETRKALSVDLNEQRENMDLPPPPISEKPMSVLWPKIFMSFKSQLECHISQKAFCGSPIPGYSPFCGHTYHSM